MIPRRVSLAIAAAALLAMAALLPSLASASVAAPAWKLSLRSMPTYFAPDSSRKPEYFLVATNAGGKATDGSTITVEDTLPAALAPLGANARTIDGSPNPSCAILAQTVTCTTTDSVRPGGPPLLIFIEVEVKAGAPAGVLDEASIEGGGAVAAAAATRTTIAPSIAPFGFLDGEAGFAAPISEADGTPATQAGSHPYQLETALGFPTQRPLAIPPGLIGTGNARDISVDLPRGTIADPSATPVRCTEAELTSKTGCPLASQVGTVTVTTVAVSLQPVTAPLFNMVPPPGVPASFGFDVGGYGLYVHLIGRVRSDGDYGLTGMSADTLALNFHPLFGAQVDLWGDPSSESHDFARGDCVFGFDRCPISAEPEETAFLTLPGDCPGKPATFAARANSWEEPGVTHEATYESADLGGNPAQVSGCNALKFEPAITAKPTTDLAEGPSGLDVNLHQPQDFALEGRSTVALKDISVALPEGMTLNPAAADGLEGCTSAQIGLLTPVGESPAHLSTQLPSCPDASKLGTVKVRTPVLAQYDEENKLERDPETGDPIPDPLEGSVYLAKPFDNPFGSLLAIYLTVEDKKTGIVAKVPAEVSADPDTGQLVTRIEENPELPLEDVSVHLFGGARGPLITPQTCGTHTTTGTATPWSAPEGKDVPLGDSFQTSALPGGGSCPTTVGAAPNNPAFTAGTIAPQAGAFSPFVLKLSREDGSQRLSGVDTTLPPGLIGSLVGTSKCSEAQLAGAISREAPNQGVVEQAHPSCPAPSEIGSVDVSAGAGPTPLYVKAHAYLAGPYKGAPLSAAIITPAVAGPFDLGTVVTRVALYVNPESAQIHAVSDPFPRVLQGIPVDVRGASLKLDKPNFTLNPTSCDPMSIVGNAPTIPGAIAALKAPFQVGGCSTLGFKPKLGLRLIGGTKRGGHPALIGTYKARTGDANTKSLVVRLPRSAFLDQAHIRTICTRVQFAANACPAGSIYGQIEATTPLLEEPLSGPVYLRSSSHKLPDLVFDLHGVIDVQVATRIDSVHGGIRASIEGAPDAPLTKVVLRMQGQKKGLIVNSRDICQGTNRADVSIGAQNGKSLEVKPALGAGCGKRRGS